MDSILLQIKEIDPDNLFIDYIINRVQRDNYRGIHISQHNRYDLDFIEKVLKSIYEIVGDSAFNIPPGDYKKTDALPSEYIDYTKIVSKIYQYAGRGTYNSIKKNFFVDLDRMGFLLRFDKKNKLIGTKRTGILYAKLSNKAIEFVSSDDNLLKKYKIFTDAIDVLFQGFISDLAKSLYYSDYKNTTISIYELMFIFSDTTIDPQVKIDLLNSYRSLKTYQRTEIINLLKKYAIPKRFTGNKITKRDFSNWKNENQQILALLKTTVYFDVSLNRYFILNIGNTGIFPESYVKRKGSIKIDYFPFHEVSRTKDFELHHIVPINKVRNKHEFQLVDNVKNLLYLAKNKHKQISNANNTHNYLLLTESDATFCDMHTKDKITAINQKDALYSRTTSKIENLLKYNRDLLKIIFDFDKEL